MSETTPSPATEVHILVGCADARDIGGIFAEAIDAVRARYASLAIQVEFHALRTAGSFVTQDVLDDLRRIVETCERRADNPVQYFVHIQTHGEVRLENSPESAAMERYAVVGDSPFNCGMLGASGVAVELEQFLLKRKPVVSVRGRERKIRGEDDIRALLADVYEHRGELAGDWIRSIDDLRTHPRLQERVLREAIKASRTLRSADISVTTGIQDYRQHAYRRLDDHPDKKTFWDDVYAELRERVSRVPPEHPEHSQRVSVQRPTLGLFAMCDFPRARQIAASHVAATLKREPSDFGPNQVFTFASESFDLPNSPFGPYTIAGFYYAVVHLRLTHFVVLGDDKAQTRRMLRRLEGDPFIQMIASSFGVTWHAVASPSHHHFA